MNNTVETFVSTDHGSRAARLVDGCLIHLRLPDDGEDRSRHLVDLLNRAFAKHNADRLEALGAPSDDELSRFIADELAKVHDQLAQSPSLQRSFEASVASATSSTGRSRDETVTVAVMGGRLTEIDVDPRLFDGPVSTLVAGINEALDDVWSQQASEVGAQMEQFSKMVTFEALADELRTVTASIKERW